LESDLQAFRKSKQTAASINQWVKLDDEFHSAIANAAGSPRLAADIDRYRLLHRIFNRSHTDVNVLQQAITEHADILAALKRRDSAAAREKMCTHLEEWQRFFANHLR
jgi:DNA-binding GntR family transcriptional regulator